MCGRYFIDRSAELKTVINEMPVFVILTREPGSAVSRIHDRMPLIIPKDMISEWIRPDSDPDMIVTRALTDVTLEKCC